MTKFKLSLKKRRSQILGLILLGFFYSFLNDLFHPFNSYLINTSGTTFLLILNFVFYVLNLKLSLWSLLLAFVTIWVIVKVYRSYQVKKRTLKIIEATYGSGNSFINISNQLNDAIQDDKLKIVLSNNIAGDPTPGIKKRGVIQYKFNNKEEKKSYNESDTIELP